MRLRKKKGEDDSRIETNRCLEREREETFGDVDVVLDVVDVEAPEETGDEVDERATDVVPEPSLEGVGEWLPRARRQQVAEHNAVVERRLVHEQLQVIPAAVHPLPSAPIQQLAEISGRERGVQIFWSRVVGDKWSLLLVEWFLTLDYYLSLIHIRETAESRAEEGDGVVIWGRPTVEWIVQYTVTSSYKCLWYLDTCQIFIIFEY